MSLQSISVHVVVKQWGNEEGRRIIADAGIPMKNKIEQILNVLNVLEYNDIAYNIADSFEKALKLMECMNLRPKW